MDVGIHQPVVTVTSGSWRYQTVAGCYDEMVNERGQIRPAWRQIATALQAMGPEELQRRWEQGRRLLHENGVTFNAYGDRQGLDRPWALDAFPMILSATEWRTIEAAVVQRATMLNRVLFDLYGPQTLLHEGILPPTLPYTNPNFLRPMQSVPVPRSIYLHLYAADLARSADGQWWFVNDRTQAPSGWGYALENRQVISRSLPEVFRDSQVHRLNEFISRFGELIFNLAPSHLDNPRIVLLTPGPSSSAYFEHVFLARQMGLTLVEGGDLTVRDERVFLKTLSGLLPVDVILRRVTDTMCDPLELNDDSFLGVAGLVEAVRTGHVAVANALGTGLIHGAMLMAHSDSLMKATLGEQAKLPTLPSWWCGDEAGLAEVERRLEKMVIKRLGGAAQVSFGEQGSDEDKQAMLSKIREHQHQYVGQERIRSSTAPTWSQGRLEPRHIMLRIYAAATRDGSYHVLPGGLTRVSASPDSTLVHAAAGGGSKDTWVLSDTPITGFNTARPGAHAVTLSRAGFVLSSRIADNLFWLGRYVERVEQVIRVVRCMLQNMADDNDFADDTVLSGLTEVLISKGYRVAPTTRHSGRALAGELEPQLMALLFDEKRPMSVRGYVMQAHRVASRVRDRISFDSWRIINRLQEQFVQPPVSSALMVGQTIERLDDAIIMISAFDGQAMEGMTREKSWRFLDLGRRVERSIAMLALLPFGLNKSDALQKQRLQAVLEIANSAMTYRSRYLAAVEPQGVLDLLLVDETNPHALTFQIAAMTEHIEKIAESTESGSRPVESRIVQGMLAASRLADVETLVKPENDGTRTSLAALFVKLRADLGSVVDAVTHKYLSHTRQPHAFGDRGVGPTGGPRDDEGLA